MILGAASASTGASGSVSTSARRLTINSASQAYIFQNPDRRIVFAIPYERDFTLIGTTDLPYQGDPHAVAISAEEISYLCEAVNRYLVKPVIPGDVVWSYSGVRPLYDDLRDSVSAVTRDYVFDVDWGNGRTEGGTDGGADAGAAPLLSIFGGKITTYRKLAEHALDKLLPRLGAGRSPRPTWTERATLPGGDLPGADFEAFPSGRGTLPRPFFRPARARAAAHNFPQRQTKP